jgi:hypothetical protein
MLGRAGIQTAGLAALEDIWMEQLLILVKLKNMMDQLGLQEEI